MQLNGRASLDPRWVKHNSTVVKGFMNCTVKVTRRNSSIPLGYNQATKKYDVVVETIYEGPARLQPYGINFDIEVGLDPTSRRLYLAQLDGMDLGIENDDVLIVTGTTNNHELMTYHFDIRGAASSSLDWCTELVLEADLKHD